LLLSANSLAQIPHMRKHLKFNGQEFAWFLGLVLLWLAAYKSADVFNFFETYSSLWFLPAGVTLAIALVAPPKLIFAPLVANLLLALPAVCNLLGIEFTTFRDPILHSFRLFVVYAGAGVLLRYGLHVLQPVSNLRDELALIIVTIAAAGVGALSGVSLHALVGNFPWSVAWDILLPWAVGDAIGALIVPPLLAPLLLRIFPSESKLEAFPPLGWIAFQVVVIALAMVIAFAAPRWGPNLGSLWYVILLPPVVFAVRGGLPAAATATALTTLLTPPAATLLGFEGERISLQFLLLVSAAISLMIGAAITDRKRAFAAVKESEEHLEQLVEDRTRELQEAYEFQRHLIRSIGHDLRQPVQSINMMLDGLVIEHKESPSLPPLQRARDIGKTASGFITRVLDYAKRDAGKVEVMTEDFPIQRVLDQVAHTFQPHAEARGVALRVEPTDLRLTSDAHLLWEALSNLVQNAVRLSKRGQTVQVAVRPTDNGMTIEVLDEIEKGLACNGQAGFGLEIVEQVARMLGAEFDLQPNRAVLRFPS
jgi:signal transduction histidine kinase